MTLAEPQALLTIRQLNLPMAAVEEQFRRMTFRGELPGNSIPPPRQYKRTGATLSDHPIAIRTNTTRGCARPTAYPAARHEDCPQKE